MKKDVYYLQTFILSLVFFQFSVGRYLIAQNTLLKNQEGGIISFYSERDGNPEIYIMNADGSAQTRLTHNTYLDNSPDLSPDGSQIVFISNRDGNKEIYKMNIDGSSIMRLTNTPQLEGYPYWSPDSTHIIYCTFLNENYEIFIMNADGSNQTRITTTPENEEWASLSPDMSKIAYTVGSFPNYDIYIMNSDGSNPSPLVTLPNIQAMPKWSPDGNTIAYSYGVFSSGNITGDIYLVNPDGTNNRMITNSGGAYTNEDPYWSPDGTEIVFQSNRSGNLQLYVMNADGSNQTRLTNHNGDDYWPSWASDTQVGVENQNKSVIDKFNLEQNFPNPFNPVTTINYQISKLSFVTLNVYDVLGNEIATLVNEDKPAGSYKVRFSAIGESASGGDAYTLASGIYFYQLKTENYIETRKMLVLK